jgi:hypothetical protein
MMRNVPTKENTMKKIEQKRFCLYEGIITSGLLAVVRRTSSEIIAVTGLGNLSTKNRLWDRFSGSKFRQVTGQRFSEPNSDRKAEQVFQEGDRILDRT